MSFKDHFSTQSAIYRTARPRYAPELFAWLAAQCPTRTLAWDAGCGTGQASLGLAGHFERVIATDPSAAQVAQAETAANLEYRVERAEHSTLEDASADLITVAQALHWFELDAFHAEVRRVLRPGGIVAQWSYADCQVTPAVDAVKQKLYVDLLDRYWPPERRLVESGYAELAFPFARLETPAFELAAHYDLAAFLAYLRSWSATQRYIAANGSDPVDELGAQFAAAWGDASEIRLVRWDLVLRVGRYD
ncbi:MAG: methyltransferase domain-containing protein [Rhodanobacteraceae bacterium]|nr:methyltransferase domain-containing protein [Rhodanobacteraceae bacterium]